MQFTSDGLLAVGKSAIAMLNRFATATPLTVAADPSGFAAYVTAAAGLPSLTRDASSIEAGSTSATATATATAMATVAAPQPSEARSLAGDVAAAEPALIAAPAKTFSAHVPLLPASARSPRASRPEPVRDPPVASEAAPAPGSGPPVACENVVEDLTPVIRLGHVSVASATQVALPTEESARSAIPLDPTASVCETTATAVPASSENTGGSAPRPVQDVADPLRSIDAPGRVQSPPVSIPTVAKSPPPIATNPTAPEPSPATRLGPPSAVAPRGRATDATEPSVPATEPQTTTMPPYGPNVSAGHVNLEVAAKIVVTRPTSVAQARAALATPVAAVASDEPRGDVTAQRSEDLPARAAVEDGQTWVAPVVLKGGWPLRDTWGATPDLKPADNGLPKLTLATAAGDLGQLSPAQKGVVPAGVEAIARSNGVAPQLQQAVATSATPQASRIRSAAQQATPGGPDASSVWHSLSRAQPSQHTDPPQTVLPLPKNDDTPATALAPGSQADVSPAPRAVDGSKDFLLDTEVTAAAPRPDPSDRQAVQLPPTDPIRRQPSAEQGPSDTDVSAARVEPTSGLPMASPLLRRVNPQTLQTGGPEADAPKTPDPRQPVREGVAVVASRATAPPARIVNSAARPSPIDPVTEGATTARSVSAPVPKAAVVMQADAGSATPAAGKTGPGHVASGPSADVTRPKDFAADEPARIRAPATPRTAESTVLGDAAPLTTNAAPPARAAVPEPAPPHAAVENRTTPGEGERVAGAAPLQRSPARMPVASPAGSEPPVRLPSPRPGALGRAGSAGADSERAAAPAAAPNAATLRTPEARHPLDGPTAGVEPASASAPVVASLTADRQPEAPPVAPAMSAEPADAGNEPVATTFDAQQVSQPLVRLLAQGGSGSLSVRLHPAGLGTVDIRVERSATGSTRVTLRAQQSETASVLSNRRAHVEAALDRAGVSPLQRVLVIERGAASITAAAPAHSSPASAATSTPSHGHAPGLLYPDTKNPGGGTPVMERVATGDAVPSGGSGGQNGQPQGWTAHQGRPSRHPDTMVSEAAASRSARAGPAGALLSGSGVDITA